MALFNSKEAERNNIKPQPVPAPQVPTAQSAPVASPSVAEQKTTNAVPLAPKVAAAANDARAYLDAGSKIVGKLHFETPARIDGHVEGEINAKDSLTVGESAVIAAQIKAASVVVAGKVSGDIAASHRIEILSSAQVLGNVTAPTLVIREGALFEGHCAMQPEAHDDRKVTVFPKEDRLVQVAGQKPA